MPDIHSLLTERGKTHGDYLKQSVTANSLKNTLFRSSPGKPELSPSQEETLHMICTKMARIVCGNPDEPDHWRDIAGYATLMADLLEPDQGPMKPGGVIYTDEAVHPHWGPRT